MTDEEYDLATLFADAVRRGLERVDRFLESQERIAESLEDLVDAVEVSDE